MYKMTNLLNLDWYDEDDEITLVIHRRDRTMILFKNVRTDVTMHDDVTSFENDDPIFGRQLFNLE